MGPILIILAGAIGLFILERIFPDQDLPKVKGWWNRVAIINAIQALIVFIGGFTWDKWFKGSAVFEIEAYTGPVAASFICYVFLTFIYYWWHRWRHTVNFLWLSMHQLHHSPSRIETLTSFYKHPVEIVANSILISFIAFTLCGLSPEAGVYLTLITAYAEFFYHMNIRTPRWIGYIIQRPEMHRIHHERGRHFDNFADLPIWDMMFGTFQNPPTYQGKCGYKPERELKLMDMMAFKNVNNAYDGKFIKKPATILTEQTE